jgi:hypothetical protein
MEPLAAYETLSSHRSKLVRAGARARRHRGSVKASVAHAGKSGGEPLISVIE